MKQNELTSVQVVLQELVRLGKAVDVEVPNATGQKLWRNAAYKQFKAELEKLDRKVNSARSKAWLDDAWLSPALTEAIGHLGGESGITRSLWALEEALDGVNKQLQEQNDH